MTDPLQIRRLQESDLDFADSIRELAGWNQLPGDWRRLLAHDPDGCFLAEWNGQPAGTATTTVYRTDLAWIGMVIVHPDLRRHGIGRALLNHCIGHLQDAGVASIKLDATPLGKTVYGRLGFVDEWGLARWEAEGLRLDEIEDPRIEWLGKEPAPSMLDLDHEAFGVSRARMLQQLASQSEMLLRRSADRKVDGYGMLRPGRNAFYLGPIVAANDEAGEAIVRALLARVRGRRVFWDVPDDTHGAMRLVKELGFTQQRVLTRMFLGANETPGRPDRIWALAAPEIG